MAAQKDKPTLKLVEGKDISADTINDLYRALTGKSMSASELRFAKQKLGNG